MSLIVSEHGCHTWVVTAGATGPILAIDGHRLQDQTRGGAAGAARATPGAAGPTPQLPLLDASATAGPAATADPTDPTITTCAWALPGTSFGVLELVGIGPLHLIVPDTEPQAWARAHFEGATLAHPARDRRGRGIPPPHAAPPPPRPPPPVPPPP